MRSRLDYVEQLRAAAREGAIVELGQDAVLAVVGHLNALEAAILSELASTILCHDEEIREARRQSALFLTAVSLGVCAPDFFGE